MSGTIDALSLPPERAIAFFRQKTNMPTRAWDDLRHGAHARAWSVAGVQSHDMLAEIRTAMDRAIAEGRTLDQFRADTQPLLQDLGWADRGPGYVAWRTRTVYLTNMRTAYAAGRYAEMTEPDVLALRPFWRYRHSGAKDFRPQHRDWDGLVLPHDDTFWQTHFPPNGWGCGCYVQSVGERARAAAVEEGKGKAPSHGARPYRDPRTNEVHELPAGIDPGWDYSVGRSWLDGVVPREMAAEVPRAPGAAAVPNLPPLPPARPGVADLLPKGLPDEDYVNAFLRPFGAEIGRPAIFRDAAGTRLVISDDFFRAGSKAGFSKVRKRGRETTVALLAEALLDPDEIWVQWLLGPDGSPQIYRSYLRRIAVAAGGRALFALMQFGARGWHGTTAFPADRDTYLDAQRFGWLAYRRPIEPEEGSR